MPRERAGLVWIGAGKECLRLAVVLGDVPTERAGAAGVLGVYQEDGDARPSGLVGDRLAQLIEGPGMPLVAIGPTNRCPRANPGQVFEGECLAGHDGFVHRGLADAVIHVLLETMLPPRVLAETALRVLGIDLLQALAACVIASASLLLRGPAEGVAFAIRGEV